MMSAAQMPTLQTPPEHLRHTRIRRNQTRHTQIDASPLKWISASLGPALSPFRLPLNCAAAVEPSLCWSNTAPCLEPPAQPPGCLPPTTRKIRRNCWNLPNSVLRCIRLSWTASATFPASTCPFAPCEHCKQGSLTTLHLPPGTRCQPTPCNASHPRWSLRIQAAWRNINGSFSRRSPLIPTTSAQPACGYDR